MDKVQRRPAIWEALIPVIFLIVALFFNVFYIFGDAALDGSNQIVLLLAAFVAVIIGLRTGMSWDDLQDGMVKSISAAMPSIFILLMIGALAGTWLISGIVPAMIYYGLDILNPTIFLFAACIVSAIVSVATGSSWSTIATIGIALLGIGDALGLSKAVVAGAIISGAYFGDKMSPLSDTTNLAPAMAGTDLFTHIKYMAYTTVPSIVITLLIFLGIGIYQGGDGQIADTEAVQAAIGQAFNINGWLFIVPALVIFLIVKKVPAFPALLIGTLLGGLCAIIFQPQIITGLGGSTFNREIVFEAGSGWEYFFNSFKAVMMAMYGDVTVATGNAEVDGLLSTGGMAGMLWTIWLIICAMIFGGVMEKAGLLQRITDPIIQMARSSGSLILSTTVSCIFFNVTASDQYLAIVVPGRMFAGPYRERGLKPKVLSRTLEDSGTVTSVLVPWNTCGATQAGILGVATGTYAPYCFFNIISPFMTVLFGYANIKIARYKDGEAERKKELV
ncbi:Na+/H+ antiporter NhaC [Roseivirga sp. BDSF3-8]|uniref:Na+/H+ antiporter NhaC n=1 Tax=Roseivirga sp. BDSF3-8 TaxID=3241598 RepID=UPI0035326CF4